MPAASAMEPGSPMVRPSRFAGAPRSSISSRPFPREGNWTGSTSFPSGRITSSRLAAYIASSDEGGQALLWRDGVLVHRRGISAIVGFADPTLNDYFGLPSWIPTNAEG